MAESRSQQRNSKGFPNAARRSMEARTPAETMKAEDSAFGQDNAENAVAALTTHRLLSKPSSARGAMEAGRGKDPSSSSPAPPRYPLLTVRTFNSKTHHD